jgi:hypothetical protein
MKSGLQWDIDASSETLPLAKGSVPGLIHSSTPTGSRIYCYSLKSLSNPSNVDHTHLQGSNSFTRISYGKQSGGSAWLPSQTTPYFVNIRWMQPPTRKAELCTSSTCSFKNADWLLNIRLHFKYAYKPAADKLDLELLQLPNLLEAFVSQDARSQHAVRVLFRPLNELPQG